MIAFADFSLEDHWNKGDAVKAIVNGKWNYVILQQGPSASKEGRATLREYARRFAEEIRRTGARPALYMVWPWSSRTQDFTGVSQSYSQAAEDIDGLVLPVGEAWLSAWRINPQNRAVLKRRTSSDCGGFVPDSPGHLWATFRATGRGPAFEVVTALGSED